MQAIVKIGSSQYTVTPGQRLLVDRPQVDGVLMVVDGASVTVGKPSIADAVVQFKVLREVKGKKVRVGKYKAKSRERKVRGFRAQYTEILIEDIYIGGKKVVKKAVKAKS